MTTTLMVRHDAPIEVTVRAGQKVLDRQIVEARLVGAHLTVQSYMRGGAYGQSNWHDNQGNPLLNPPTVSIRLTDRTYELAVGQECSCDECKENH